jgi:hypothetical protein
MLRMLTYADVWQRQKLAEQHWGERHAAMQQYRVQSERTRWEEGGKDYSGSNTGACLHAPVLLPA